MIKQIKIAIFSRCLFIVTRCLLASYRYRVIGQENRSAAQRAHPSGSFCLVVWHEHLFATTLAHKGQAFSPLASPSSDGSIASYLMKKLGFIPTRGSSSRGGEAARKQLIEQIQRGISPAITVDGPRGPRRQVKGGAIDIARKTGVAIVPAVAASENPWIFRKSWDQFKIPRPFSRIVLSYGPPIFVPESADAAVFVAVQEQIRSAIDAAEQHAVSAVKNWT